MQPHEFAQKWRTRAYEVTEEQAYQEHYQDVASLVGGFAPGQAGAPEGLTYQAGVKKVGTTDFGKADVFQPGHFIWEAKRAAKTDAARAKVLGGALQQATLYARDLGNPPLIVTTDFVELNVHTNFTGTAPKTFRLTLDDIEQDGRLEGTELTALQVLRAVFHDPGVLDPRLVRERITTEATGRVGEVARALVSAGHPKEQVAHFLMRVVFAMFSEDVGLLEKGLLTKLLERARKYPEKSQGYFAELFSAMSTGGEFWGTDIRYFNGGLLDDHDGLPITAEDAEALLNAAKLDWAEVEPAIFGGLFESSLEKEVRGQRGAHFTAVTEIERIVEPVVMLDLHRQWEGVRARARAIVEQAEIKAQAEAGKGHTRVAEDTRAQARKQAIGILHEFQQHLGSIKVLDAACGSGNFLYVTLKRLLDLEHEVRLTAFQYGAGDFDLPPLVHPRQMLGIEIEGFAAELAGVTLWIGYFQWNRAHGGQWPTPVLERLDNIQHHDALLNDDGTEFQWPDATYIVGNPPFLGDKMMRSQLGDQYVETLREVYAERLPGQSDLVCYWPEKARAAIEAGVTRRAGFVTTNSVRGGKNRTVLERIKATGDLFMAWPDEPWTQDGAAVRVSLFAFDDGQEAERTWNGQPASHLNADLSIQTDTKAARILAENTGKSFIGTQKGGDFDIPPSLAQAWLNLPNPTGVDNRDVLKPWTNGMDITRRPSHRWIIDFAQMTEQEAAQYLQPFAYVEEKVRPTRQGLKRAGHAQYWWRHQEARPGMRRALEGQTRFIGIPRVAKHLLPVWLPIETLPDSQVVVIARDDDFTLGVLMSSVHRIWALIMGTALEDRPRYTPSTCFETFPFPHPSADQRAEIEKWARHIVQVREHLLAADPKATLTGLYNDVVKLRAEPDAAHPVSALKTAHDRLDQAVAAAYSWEWPLAEDEVLARLLALNLERSATPGSARNE